MNPWLMIHRTVGVRSRLRGEVQSSPDVARLGGASKGGTVLAWEQWIGVGAMALFGVAAGLFVLIKLLRGYRVCLIANEDASHSDRDIRESIAHQLGAYGALAGAAVGMVMVAIPLLFGRTAAATSAERVLIILFLCSGAVATIALLFCLEELTTCVAPSVGGSELRRMYRHSLLSYRIGLTCFIGALMIGLTLVHGVATLVTGVLAIALFGRYFSVRVFKPGSRTSDHSVTRASRGSPHAS